MPNFSIYDGTVEEIEEELEDVIVLQEYTDMGAPEGVAEEIGETTSNSKGSMISINWTVSSNVLKKTNAFSANLILTCTKS